MTNRSSKRYLVPFIQSDLKEKLVLLSGPRQVGKTTLALKLLGGQEDHPAYFNWDDDFLLCFVFVPFRRLLKN